MKVIAMLGAGLALLGLATVALADPQELRIGYQKGSIALVLAKEHGLLEKRFARTKVQWIEFPAGPQMLEALNIGSLDVGSTGDIPPLFAQAAGADLVYIGAEPAKPSAEVILVRNDSAFRQVADLKGRKVALQKGSSSHNLVLRALNKAGLGFKGIQPVYLTPADARAAFEHGSVDAWAVWDPYVSLALSEGHSRKLADGQGLGLSGPIYTARRAYAAENGEFIHSLLDQLTAAEELTRSDRAGSLKVLSASMGLPEAVVASYVDNRPPSPVLPITDEVIAAQQATADLFYENRLLPKRLEVKRALP
ncbi:sulfonate ABC transporter substrate-binding protein [Pseudomonas putida CSV86]|uniref:Putative aliphatic sulfonates-binding protein n=1 Tax=Pseudomonas bharatica CSV86 TaxID=1005395 RepID=L1M4P0_9PSED|nr:MULTISPECIES: sulfonate ABC transporter substrate-binding protein [Pseudomonas]MDG9885189.1 sulfonate ABC transporter substrate-binding protein [Pseudomonas sp. GD04058]NNJ18166.1 sulfonate ABC transporter substrate-binding protein [Pseudomonas bharatica CSV86]